jgi:hypothetical protein
MVAIVPVIAGDARSSVKRNGKLYERYGPDNLA